MTNKIPRIVLSSWQWSLQKWQSAYGEALSETLDEARERDIMQSMNLDNGIAQDIEEPPCTEGETDMAKRQRFHVDLPSGERVWFTGNTVSEAFANALEKYGGGVADQKAEAPTVRAFVEQTYRPLYIQNLAPTTIGNYELYLKLYILPFMGEMKLNEINVTTIQQFYDWMANASQHGAKKDLNAKSIERVSGLLGRIFRVAVEMGLIRESPIKRTLLQNHGKPAEHHKAIAIADMKQIKTLIPTLERERERLLMALLAYTGMRPEEIRGLRWENVHLEEGYCDMVRTVTYDNRSKAMSIRECGKTENAIRTVLLPNPAVQILQQVTNKTGYVLGGESPLCYSTFKWTYEPAFEQLGIKGKYSLYDFRTTYGTELCEAGLTSKQVGDMMGHADARMVETVYGRRRHEGIMKQREMLNELNEEYAS